jgi:hypothetical protein
MPPALKTNKKMKIFDQGRGRALKSFVVLLAYAPLLPTTDKSQKCK